MRDAADVIRDARHWLEINDHRNNARWVRLIENRADGDRGALAEGLARWMRDVRRHPEALARELEDIAKGGE